MKQGQNNKTRIKFILIDRLDRIPVASKKEAEVVPVHMEEPLKAE